MPSASVSKRPHAIPLIRISVSLVPVAVIDLVNIIMILIDCSSGLVPFDRGNLLKNPPYVKT
mgnify:CR=1 FL=1